MKNLKHVIIIIFLLILYIYIANITLIPGSIVLLQGEEFKIKKTFGVETIETAITSNSNYNISNVEVSLFGKLPVKNVAVTTIENAKVVPIGKIIGLKLYTNGVLIVGMSEIEDENSILSKPYENSDIKEGDTILKINEKEIEDIENLKDVVNSSNGKKLELTLLRDGSIVTSNITPIQTKNKEYKLGLWVKDAATGVGTMTFYEPESKVYAVLGHGITDADTDSLINIDSGELVTSRIISIKKGEVENPGEIKGTILNQQTIGEVIKNTQFGIYGKLNNLTSLNIDTSKVLDVALREEIEIGEAKVLCAIDNSNVAKEYSIEIEKIYTDNEFNNKSMLIKVTDEELLEKTGNIINNYFNYTYFLIYRRNYKCISI